MDSHLGRNSLLYTDLYELTMAQAYFSNGRHEASATFDYFFRNVPFDGGYVIFCGLEDLLEEIRQLRVDADGLAFLREHGFSSEFLKALENFRFSGDILAPREGEAVFPQEPVLQVTAPIWQGQILETMILNFLNFQSLVATKTTRVCRAAGERPVVDFGLRRVQGTSGLMFSRAAVAGGARATSNVAAAQCYGLSPSGTMAHAWVQSHEDELEAFENFVRVFPDRAILLVDTYDTLQSGVQNAIALARRMREKNKNIAGIRLDSGDLAYLSKQARYMLDEAGFPDIKIIASNQLDEYVIKSLLEQRAPIDIFGVGSGLLGGRSHSALDGVYKLASYAGEPRMKLSENITKVTLPGPKRVLRMTDETGTFRGDAVVCEDEQEPAMMIHPWHPEKRRPLTEFTKEELLFPVMRAGERLHPSPTVKEIGDYAYKRLEQLPEEYKRFENPHIYKVGLSERLHALRAEMQRNFLQRE